MIDFKLNFTYSDAKEKSLDGMSGKVEKGKCVVLCGNSGCGKSTMIRTVNRLIPQFYEGEIDGYCKVAGNNLDSLSIGEVGKIVSSVFQDPRSQFFTMNSCTELAFALENFGVLPDDISEKIDRAFSLFSLEHLKDRNVFELSSGEKQLIAILCMWVMDNDICILDEPTANLDYNAILELAQCLKVLKEQGKTILINEHRLYYLSEIADEYWQMECGKIKEKFSKEQMKSFSVSQLNNMGLRTNALDSLIFKPLSTESENEQQLIINDIAYKYKKSNSDILKKFTFQSKVGDVVAIIGSNGCGKTTLGKIMTGLIKQKSGDISFNGKTLTRKELLSNSIFIMQETEFQFFTNSVYGELTYGKKETAELKSQIETTLKKFDMWHLKERHPFSLSGGQMQKLSLLIAYFSNKPILVLDEPTAGLDYISLKNCIDLIKDMRKTKIIFVITHDLEFISKSSNKAVFLKNGKNSREFQIYCDDDFKTLKDFMKNNLNDEHIVYPNKKLRLIDPRIKLFLLLNSIIAEALALPYYLITSFVFAMMIALYEKRYKVILFWGLLFGGIQLLPLIISNHFTIFLSQLLPRFIMLGSSITIAASNDGSSKLIAALRKIRIHEKIIMISSVTLRFFPVLSNDFIIMKQAIKTRSEISSNKDRIRSIPFLLEILIVPLTFRVIKIAEVLSASAQTRGIDLKNKRTSFIKVKFKTADYIMIICFALLLIANFLH